MKEENKQVIIIGSGPAGLMCGLECARAGLSVVVIEKNKQIGKKMLASGGGQCNFTHDEGLEAMMTHYGSHGTKLKHALKAMSSHDLRAYVKVLGLASIVREDGKVFPSTMKAQDLVDAFVMALKHHGGKFVTQGAVEAIDCRDGLWWVFTQGGAFKGENLVVATGGHSYPLLGTSGDAQAWFKSLDLAYVEPRPALSGLTLGRPFDGLAGTSFESCGVSLKNKGHLVSSLKGGMVITHQGLSGPVILNQARYMHSVDQVVINWLNQDKADLTQTFLEDVTSHGKRYLKTWISDLPLTKAFSQWLMEDLGLDGDIRLAEVDKKTRETLVMGLTHYSLKDFKVVGFERAMATAGGLSLDEVSLKTFMVKKHPGLFAIGEVLDIDGDTGGYNIHAAFSMGYQAAKALVKRCSDKR